LRFKKVLLEADMLKPGAGRIYDYNSRNDNGDNEWCLRIDAEVLKDEATLLLDGQEEV
jgi:hypothetical protein